MQRKKEIENLVEPLRWADPSRNEWLQSEEDLGWKIAGSKTLCQLGFFVVESLLKIHPSS